MAGKITTLYINDTSIRLLVSRGKRISKMAGAPLDISSADTSAQDKEAEIVAKLKQLLKTHKIKAKKVIVALSGLHCLSRPVALPQLPRAMLDEAVVREAKRVLPVPPEQLYISWQTISATAENAQAFMVAMPRQIADTMLRILQQVGLKPYLMDIKPLALARLVKETTAIVVDVQPNEFDIVIMVDSIPQPVRTIAFPQEAFSLSDRMSMVRDELERTIDFYNSNNPDRPIKPNVTMYVSGELADEPELYESLANELGYPVSALSSPLKCPKQLNPALYLVNIGLALKESPKEAGPLLPNLNTLPTPYQPKQISMSRAMVLPSAAVAVGFILLLAMTIQNAAASIDSVHNQLDATNSILEQRQLQKKELLENIAALEQKLADTEAAQTIYISALNGLDEQGDMFNGNLEATVYNVVSGIDLNNINQSTQSLNIDGRTLSKVEVLEYARNLDATGRFPEVTIASARRVGAISDNESSDNESDTMTFNLILRLEGIK